MSARVSLVNYTRRAAETLIFTKSTRLTLSPSLWDEICRMSDDQINAELAYMATTIRSSWEFVDLTFLVEGVTRACAQQMTRTRTASYAMQSQRVTDASQMEMASPFAPDSPNDCRFGAIAAVIKNVYADMIADGAKAEEARAVLPMNTTCNLVVKYNLRSFADVLAARKSLRAQGEYADIVRQMEALALEVWPWAAAFFQPQAQQAIELLEAVAKEIGVTTGHGPGWQIAKAIDLLRKG